MTNVSSNNCYTVTYFTWVYCSITTMNKWKGKSKGTILGYKIFVWCIRNTGIRISYLVLYFVAFYYFLFEKNSNRYYRYYFSERLKYSFWKTKISLFKSYFTFGTVLIDKTAISAGLREKYTYEFDGIENLRNLLAEKKRRRSHQCAHGKF